MAVALMKVAGLYLRKSSEDERSAEDGRSVERQREHATAFAAAMGWRVDPDLIFSDEAISGGEFKRRPGLARLLAALETKTFEALIVMDQSRLGRETIRTLALIRGIGLLGRPASESGRLRHGDGDHGRGDRRRTALMSTILFLSRPISSERCKR